MARKKVSKDTNGTLPEVQDIPILRGNGVWNSLGLDRLEPGQSVWVAEELTASQVQGIYKKASGMELKFATRKEDGGTRVGRVA